MPIPVKGYSGLMFLTVSYPRLEVVDDPQVGHIKFSNALSYFHKKVVCEKYCYGDDSENGVRLVACKTG